jgi:hypothetical protein
MQEVDTSKVSPLTNMIAIVSPLRVRFTKVHDYAVKKVYVGGFPTMHEADYGQGVVYGCTLIKPWAADWMDVPAVDK